MYKFISKIKGLLFLVVVTFYCFLITKYGFSIVHFLKTNPELLLYTIAFSLTALLNQSVSYLYLLAPKNKIPLLPFMSIWATCSLLNYLGPMQPGSLARSLFLKRFKIDVAYSFIVSIRWTAHSIWLGLLLLSMLLVLHPSSNFEMIAIVLATGLLVWPVIQGTVQKQTRNLNFVKKLEKKSGVNLKNIATIEFSPLFIFLIIQYLIMMACYYVIFSAFSEQTNMLDMAMLSIVLILSTVIALTPNGLGINEFILAIMSYKYSLSAEELASLLLIPRISHIMLCSAFSIPGLYYDFKFLRKADT